MISAACLLGFLVAASTGAWADEHKVGWLSSGCVAIGGGMLGVGLVMAGRALQPGRLTRAMFRVPPSARRAAPTTRVAALKCLHGAAAPLPRSSCGGGKVPRSWSGRGRDLREQKEGGDVTKPEGRVL